VYPARAGARSSSVCSWQIAECGQVSLS
jgi:hypothetical protein